MKHHMARVSRYRSDAIRSGLIAYHDLRATEKVEFTSEPDRITTALRTLSNSVGLYSALKDVSEWEWRASADKVVILLNHTQSKCIGRSMHDLINISPDVVWRL